MKRSDLGEVAELLSQPILLLDEDGRLQRANVSARALIPGIDSRVDSPLRDSLDQPQLFDARLRECRASSSPLPARLHCRVGENTVAVHAGIRFLPSTAGRGAGYLIEMRQPTELASRFLGVREQMDRLDAELARRARAESALGDREAWLRVVLKSIADAVVTTDIAGMVTWMNPAAERLTGWELNQALDRPVTAVMDLLHEETRRTAPNPVFAAIRERRSTGMLDDTVLLRRDGTMIAVEDAAAPILDDRARLVGAVIVFHDVSDKRQLVREMAVRASHDALTGLLNRFAFEAALEDVLSASRSKGQEHCLMYLDLDHFKVVNDTCGHSVGDQLLKQIASLLEDALRSSDVIARLGGDEFGIIMPRCGVGSAQRVADEIHRSLHAYRFEHDDRRFQVGASIGLVEVDQRWRSGEEVMQAADTACYAAKESGGRQTHFWQKDGEAAEARGRMAWVQRITQALEEDCFELFLQRIEAVHDGAGPSHVEALIRLRGESGELIAPGMFLPAAERFSLAPSIDLWVLSRVLDSLRADPRAHVQVAINFSGQSIGDKTFRADVLRLLHESGPECTSRLCIEITETAAVNNLTDAARFMGQLRDLGILVALDDFGAGASSFGYLRLLPIDLLKIDGQFVESLPDDRLGATAVRCFVEAAKVVGARSIAERVETQDALECLRLLGVDMVQGYHLHRPEPWNAVWSALPRRPSARSVG